MFELREFDADLVSPLTLREKARRRDRDKGVGDDDDDVMTTKKKLMMTTKKKSSRLRKVRYALASWGSNSDGKMKDVLLVTEAADENGRRKKKTPPDAKDLMKREKFVYLGSYDAAKEKEQIKARRITHVLTIAPKLPLFTSSFEYLIVLAEDDADQNLVSAFLRCISFIESVESGQGILIHW